MNTSTEISSSQNNLPSQEEIFKVLESLGYQKCKNTIHPIIQDLDTVFKNGQDVALKSIEGEKPDKYELSGVFNGKLKLSITKETKIQVHDSINYLPLTFFWEKLEPSSREIFMKYFTEEDLSHLSEYKKSAVAIILTLENPSHIPDVLLEKFGDFSLLMISYPRYLGTRSSEFQNNFFSIWFKSQKNNTSLQDSQSAIWEYLLKYFGNIKIVQEQNKKISLGKKETKRIVEQTQETVSEKLEEEINTPKKEELQKLMQVYNISDDLSGNLIEQILSIPQVKSKGAKYTYDGLCNDFFNGSFKKDTILIESSVENLIQKGFLLFPFIKWETLSRNTQKKIVKKVELLLKTGRNIIENAIYSLIFLEDQLINTKNDKNQIIARSSLLLLTYPPFLNKHYPRDKGECLFKTIFESGFYSQLLEDIDSFFWEYLLKYFGDFDVIKKEYKKILQNKKDKFNKIQNRFNAEGEKVEEYKKVEEASVEIHKKGDSISITPPSIKGKFTNLHVIIYERSQKGKISSPTFHVFDSKQIEYYTISGKEKNRYSYIAFWSRQQEIFSSIASLPDDIRDFQEKSVPHQQENSPTPPSSPKTLKPQKEKSENISREPDFSSLETCIFSDENSTTELQGPEIIFTFSLNKKLLQEWNMEGIIQNYTINYSISEKGITLINFLGIPNYKIHEEDLSSHLKEKIQERLAQESQKKETLLEQEINDMLKNQGKWAEVLEEAKEFFDACKKDDLQFEHKGKKLFIWQKNIGEKGLQDINKLIGEKGFSLSIEQNTLFGVTHMNVSHDGYTNSFDITSSSTVKDMSYSHNKNKDDIKDALLQEALSYILAYLSKNYYDNSKSKDVQSQRKVLRHRISERKEAKQSLISKLNEGTASFIDGYIIKEEGKVGWDHPNINDFPLLGKRWSFRIGGKGNNSASNKLIEVELDKMKDLLSGESSEIFVSYFYKRLLKTLDPKKGGFSQLTNKKAQKIIQTYSDKILRADNDVNSQKKICETLLHYFYDAGIPLYFIEATDFAYSAISHFKNKKSI